MKKIKTSKIDIRKLKINFWKKQVKMLKKSLRRFLSNIHCVMICGILCLMIFAGCGRDVSVIKNGIMEESFAKAESMKEEAMKEKSEKAESEKEDAKDSTSENQDTEQESDTKGTELSHDKALQEQEMEHAEEENLIYVDLGGAVKMPGVYSLTEGSRVFEAIALAGGFTEDAYRKSINQAKILVDGEQIYVYTTLEAEELLAEGVLPDSSLNGDASIQNNVSADQSSSDRKVNLNLADKETLMTLNGIGATRADAILQYRIEHGKFERIEELMQVDGIKEKTYEKIKDCITVQ